MHTRKHARTHAHACRACQAFGAMTDFDAMVEEARAAHREAAMRAARAEAGYKVAALRVPTRAPPEQLTAAEFAHQQVKTRR